MDDVDVLLSERQLSELAEYTTTLPSGVYPGKCWKRKSTNGWLLCWYGEETPQHQCPIDFRHVLVVS